MAIVADFDPTTPSIARVYDYLLEGKDNFAVDREVAQRMMAVAPLTAEVTRENRQFLARAVAWAANRGITQFIDLGCGLPTAPNTHETARAIAAGARVAYLDNDAVVLSHLHALAAKGNPGVTVVDGDVREVATVLGAVAAGIDLSAPACLLMGFLLHFFASGESGLQHLLLRGGAGVQPLGAGLRQLLRRPGAGAARRGRRPGVAPGLGAGRAPPAPRRPGDRGRGPGRLALNPGHLGPDSQSSSVSTIRPRRPPAATRRCAAATCSSGRVAATRGVSWPASMPRC